MSVLVTALCLTLWGADEPAYLDAPLIEGAVPMQEPGRFESPRPYNDTLDYYKWFFRSRGGVRWRNIVNLPQVRAKHIESIRPKTKWQGLNIYEKQGKVRIFVVPRDPVEPTVKEPAPEKE